MEIAGGVAVAGAASAKAIYNYNWENFKYDRLLRMKKEFQLMKFRIEQGNLWRDDVRDLCSLTEYKMHVYLLVNVLLLGFTIMLFCMGRLPDNTPEWMMMGSSLAITGAFGFLMLSIWLAMHAAVAAQAYETRILTQLVRLPIPTWQELEACRSCGSDFEKLEVKQMFRVPFVTGRQEDLVAHTESPVATGNNSGPDERVEAGEPRSPAQLTSSPNACDPWGLERPGDKISELGISEGSDVAKLRHVRLARQAMVYWQTYDAFARISMSIGVIELLLAMSYYILGYVLVQDGSRSAASYGVALLTAMAMSTTKLDMSLTAMESRSVQFLMALCPFLSCIAGYHWSHFNVILGFRASEIFIVVAFLSHAFFLGVMVRLCRISEQDNGTMLPAAFRSVLYLDVFGWLRGNAADDENPEPVSMRRRRKQPGSANLPLWERSGLGASGAFESVLNTSTLPPSGQLTSLPEDAEWTEEADYPEVAFRPSTAAVSFGDDGRPVPLRPEDLAPVGAVEDLRHELGAPRGSYHLPAGDETHSEAFFSAARWMQGEVSKRALRCKCGYLHMHEDSVYCRKCGTKRPEVDDDDLEAEDLKCVTGHESHNPGHLPWLVFSTGMLLLSFSWVMCGFYHVLVLSSLVALTTTVIYEPPAHSNDEPWERDIGFSELGVDFARKYDFKPSREGLRLEQIPTLWPRSSVRPVSLSCDAAGRRFVVADHFRALYAEYGAEEISEEDEEDAMRKRAGRTRGSMVGHIGATFRHLGNQPSLLSANFTELVCPGLRGEELQDAAVVCGSGSGSGLCDAVVLHRRGRRLSTCIVAPTADTASARAPIVQTSAISTSWLQGKRAGSQSGGKDTYVELTASLSMDPVCANGRADPLSEDCRQRFFAATSLGRVVRLEHHTKLPEFVPAEVLSETPVVEASSPPLGSGTMRMIGDGFLGVLRDGGRQIDLLDLERGGATAGRIKLPGGQAAVSFCSGGGFLYFLGGDDSSSPGVFRVSLPKSLAKSDMKF